MRSRACSLLGSLHHVGAAPQVPGLGVAQWEAFLSIYPAQEQNVLHLVQPVWEAHYRTVWNQAQQDLAFCEHGTFSADFSQSGLRLIIRCLMLLSQVTLNQVTLNQVLSDQKDGEHDFTGLSWHLLVRDRVPLDLLAMLPYLLRQIRHEGTAAIDASWEASEMSQTAPLVPEHDEDDGSMATSAKGVTSKQADDSGFGEALSILLADTDCGTTSKGKLYQLRTLTEAACDFMYEEVLEGVEQLSLNRRIKSGCQLIGKSSQSCWVVQITPADLPVFLNKSVKQAANSCRLETFKFPKLCVLVLGNEQNGMPPNLGAHGHMP
ncbi:hypothetical protein CEUSTIGMA_g12609.t1 [Chlamydomonas eustigma]|uniref:Uncharacterized protein n=1 Tax=Chlamydomonas eustigma TaxID=1157962 RepID=A0A250XQ34_9CHLO|nr:hypothetical protein CEUSTIGMA_g12609.t1 [Chlamydomonas eustigma]|eukprot:GAX85191.1 hypothetical protein CEUSTIGMA_g12609.t1 [Chlamydomonas eustigma]